MIHVLFSCVLTQLSFGFIVGIISRTNFSLQAVDFTLNNFCNTGHRIGSRILRLVPVEIVKIFRHSVLLVNCFDIPLMALFFLQIQILFINFFQKPFNY